MKRNYGIDLLRIISMFMVAVLHVLGQGGVLANAEPLSLKYWIAWLLEIISYCAVNCFSLISGYVMSQAEPKASRVLRLWLQTVFYTGLAVILFAVFKPAAVDENIIRYAIFPITNSQYWYITAYFGMLILTPLLNTVINYTDKKVFGTILISAFVLFCIFPVMLQASPYTLNKGYSMIWLSLLYLVGGYMRKYDITNTIQTSYAWLTALVMLTITFLNKFVIENFFQDIPFISSYKNAFISYTSPTIVLISIGLLIICSKLNLKPGSIKVIRFVSPAVLGVYLSHVNPLVWQNIMKSFAVSFLKYNCFGMVCLVILSAFVIFIVGIGIDLIRIKLFDLLRINKLCALLDKHLFKSRSKV